MRFEHIHWLASLAIILMIEGCHSMAHPLGNVGEAQIDSLSLRRADSFVALLRPGDLVVRQGNDLTSYMLSMLNETDHRYSHCGIVLSRKGQNMIYHSIGGEDNPKQTMLAERAQRWCSPTNNLRLAVYRFPFADSTLGRLDSLVQDMYNRKVTFDMSFDLGSNDQLYCAEMVYKAIVEATGDSSLIRPLHLFGYTYVPVDVLYASPKASCICSLRYK